MARILLLLIALVPAVAMATVYKYVDQDGNVVFTDQPHPDAKKLDLPPVPTYSAPEGQPAQGAGPKQSAPEQGAADQGSGYQRFAIVQPAGGATIRSNAGTVEVQLAVEPKLHKGDRIVVTVDGQARWKPTTSTHISLPNLDRGEHQVAARIINGDGQEVASAGPVTIYLHRQSRLFPNRNPSGQPSSPVNNHPNVLSSHPNVVSPSGGR
ncbi:MAG TPA: DUF4124 domain-containing protein [Gammaproteobacteria bacterium]|nr:DUF4124 domain-containing protein [Gammaproteobacteria bacterium]